MKLNKIKVQKRLEYYLKGSDKRFLASQFMLLIIVYIGEFGFDDFLSNLLKYGVEREIFLVNSLEGLFEEL